MAGTSGHGAMKENYFLDDGTYSASQIIIEMVKRKLEGQGDVTIDLLNQLKEPNESREFRLKIKVLPRHACHAEALHCLPSCACALVMPIVVDVCLLQL